EAAVVSVRYIFFLVPFLNKVKRDAVIKLQNVEQHEVKDEVVAMKNQIIGSRPPRCERLCGNCGHCEAVQVPVNTQAHKRSFSSSIPS
ncbi:hypothetical protein J0J23_22595, partial [Vibrio vulnificus]|uniref:epidermal patterning factor protein n=1 Tax=Vibrio vulnificus TaxID=672 RepID=UPI0019D4D032